MNERGVEINLDLTFPHFSDSGRFLVETRQEIARAAIGNKHYWGVEEWIEHYNYPFTEEQLQTIERIPWSSVELESVRHTHFLHLGVPRPSLRYRQLTVLAWREMPGVSINISDSLKNNTAVVDETLSLRWYLTKLESVKSSENLLYEEQLHLLRSNEEPPSAIEVAQAFLLYEKLNLERINRKSFLRTRNLVGKREVISMGYLSNYDANGIVKGPLQLMRGSQNIACPGGGIGASMKFLK